MKILISICITLLSAFTFAQVSGEVAKDQRKIESVIDYTLYSSSKTGYFTFKIAVNNEGKVTSCVLDRALSTVISTPLMMQAKNRILAELKFEKATRYPKFHQGIVKLTLVNIKNQNDTIKKEEN